MKKQFLRITENREIAPSTYRMKLTGKKDIETAPGRFVNIAIDGFYLRRPISVCDVDGNEMTLIYKTVGGGTKELSGYAPGRELDVLTDLGNGYDTSVSGNNPILLGGGAGVPPLYYLAKKLISEGKTVNVVLGFNTGSEVFYQEEFKALGAGVTVMTVDGSYGNKGFVTDALPLIGHSYTYACGPLPMLKAVYSGDKADGQYSFEERMGCGFGACMGCTCKTKKGFKRICKEGPVLRKEEIVWED